MFTADDPMIKESSTTRTADHHGLVGDFERDLREWGIGGTKRWVRVIEFVPQRVLRTGPERGWCESEAFVLFVYLQLGLVLRINVDAASESRRFSFR